MGFIYKLTVLVWLALTLVSNGVIIHELGNLEAKLDQIQTQCKAE